MNETNAEALLAVKVRLAFDAERRCAAIRKAYIITDPNTGSGLCVLRKEFLGKSGEWIEVPQGAMIPEECKLPIEIFTDTYLDRFDYMDGYDWLCMQEEERFLEEEYARCTYPNKFTQEAVDGNGHRH